MHRLIAACSLLPLLYAVPALAQDAQPTPDALYGKWQLVQLGGKDAAADVKTTLVFGADGAAGGQGGCNLYFATSKADGSAISFSGIGSTMMACEGARMEQEHSYFATLETVKAWSLDGTRLQLLDGGGKAVASFVPVATLSFDIPDAKAETVSVAYRCDDGSTPAVDYLNAGSTSLAVLTLDGQTVVASNVLAASGAKYAGQQYVWWTKGPHADLYDLTKGEDAKPISCEAAE